MTEIIMLEDKKGSGDGFTVQQFEKGGVYEVRENLAREFFSENVAIKTGRQTTKEWHELLNEKGVMQKICIDFRRKNLAGTPEVLYRFDKFLEQHNVNC